jgi:acyl-CoA thioester hydrolase
MGVVYYANYLVYFERVRNQLMRDLGFPYARLEAAGVGLPVVEAHVQYRLPAGYDDVLTLTAEPDWFRGARLRVSCTVLRDGELLAAGHTVHCCLSLSTRRPVRVPPELCAALERAVRPTGGEHR